MTKEQYYKYFSHMEQEHSKTPLGGMAWDDISYFIYNAIEVDKVFSKDELEKCFPFLFGK